MAIKKIAETETMIEDLGHRVKYHWIPGHMDIKGNEIADKAVKEAAAHPITQHTRRIPLQEQFTTISHLNRYAKEKRTEERRQWLQKTMAPRLGYCLSTETKPDPTAIKTTKRIATRYYQLKIGHEVIGVHLKWKKQSRRQMLVVQLG
jgi:hypothetical protein